MSADSDSINSQETLQVVIPANSPRNRNRVLARLGTWGLKRLGWQIKGGFVDRPKLIVVFAPHTSNWDWIIGVCALWALELRFSYLIKDSAFVWPLSILLRRTGGIATDRSRPGGIVDQVVEEFNKADQLYYAITPEGTRKQVKSWKTGFLRIAYKAEVPILPVSIDYPKKQILVPEPLVLSGDIEADMQMIRSYYQGFRGRY